MESAGPDRSHLLAGVIGALSTLSSRLISVDNWPAAVPEVLVGLGEALSADRVHLFENYRRADGRLIARLVDEWCSDGVGPAFSGGSGTDTPYGEQVVPFGEDRLAHETTHGDVSGFEESQRLALDAVSVRYVVLSPVLSAERWWGTLGVHYCEAGHRWSELDDSVLRMTASVLGAAVSHRAPQPAAEHYRELVEQIPAILYIDDLERQYSSLYVGPQIETILGISRETWLSEDDAWERHMHPDDWERTTRQYEDFLASGGSGSLVQEYRMIRPDDGKFVWIRDECTTVLAKKGAPGIIKGVMYDITEQKHLEEQLRAADAKRTALIEQIPGVVYVQPLSDTEEEPFVSAAIESLLGCTQSQWFDGRWWLDHLHEDDRDRVLEARKALESHREPMEVEYRLRLGAERVIWVNEVAQLLLRDGRPWVQQGFIADISRRKEAEEQMAFLAYHDVLTGLPNRAMFDEHLEMALSRARRRASAVAVLYVDIDDLKLTNDSLGHRVGDELLQETANRLRSAVRKEDLVGRQGGDEFLVMVPDLELGPPGGEIPAGAAETATCLAVTIAERICTAMRLPIETSAGLVVSSASIGISLFPIDAEDPSALLHHADAAMYRSKQKANGSFGVYSEPTLPQGASPLSQA